MLPLLLISGLLSGAPQQVWLGVVVEPATDGGISCAQVIAVVPRSPAARCLRPGDCILRVAGLPVSDHDGLSALHLKHQAGDHVRIDLRGGRAVSVQYEALSSERRSSVHRRCRTSSSIGGLNVMAPPSNRFSVRQTTLSWSTAIRSSS